MKKAASLALALCALGLIGCASEVGDEGDTEVPEVDTSVQLKCGWDEYGNFSWDCDLGSDELNNPWEN